MNNDDKVTLTFTVGEVRDMLRPLYELSIIDNPKWLQGQIRIYDRLLHAIEESEVEE